MRFLLFVISFATFANEPPLFKPHEHPAKLQRTITGFTEPCRFIEIEAEYPERLGEYKLEEGQKLPGQDNSLIAVQNSKLVQLELKAAEAASRLRNNDSRLKKPLKI